VELEYPTLLSAVLLIEVIAALLALNVVLAVCSALKRRQSEESILHSL
jgi:hypothetical protein